jgi:hypothetical protein
MRVQALNYGTSATSFTPLPSALTLASPPVAAAPTNILATQITANWTSGGNPAGTTYIAQISADPGFNTVTSSTTFNTFADLSRSLGKHHLLHARPGPQLQGSQATSLYAASFSLTLASPPGPAAPTNIQPLRSPPTGPPAEIPRHHLRSPRSAPHPGFASAARLQYHHSIPSRLFTGLSANTTYYMRVQALNYGTRPPALHPLPSALTLASPPVGRRSDQHPSHPDHRQLDFRGTPAGTTYVAQISIDPGFGTFTSSTTSNTFATFNSLSTNTTYYMRVQAISQGGTHTGFTPLPAALTLANPPGAAAPTNILATQITANWTSRMATRSARPTSLRSVPILDLLRSPPAPPPTRSLPSPGFRPTPLITCVFRHFNAMGARPPPLRRCPQR